MCDIIAMLLKGPARHLLRQRPVLKRTGQNRDPGAGLILVTRMVSSSPLRRTLLLLLIIIAVAEGRPSPRRPDAQVLRDLFGLKISSLLLAHPEVSEGSADEAPPPSRVFLDLGRHRKLQGRSRKGVARGCFGMKVDRIGVISGLGC